MNRDKPIMDTEELTFSRTLFGYDPLEVRAFVREANERIDRLSSQGTRISGENGGMPELGLSGAIASAVREIDEVLESARLAAQRIRASAEVDVTDSVESAHRRGQEIIAEAEDEAFTLRQVAWEAATEMLVTVRSEVAELRAEAERDALQIIDDAERRAMRELAAARRDSENVLQTARMEYDRLVELASAAGAEVDAGAEGCGEVPAAEDSEPDTAPTKRLVVEVPAANGQVDEPEPPASPEVYGTIRVIPAEAQTEGGSAETSGSDDDQGVKAGEPAIRLGWADGTRSVRLVGTPATRARVEVDAEEMALEVARLREGPDRSAGPAGPPKAATRPGPGRVPVTARSNGDDPSGKGPSDDELAVLFSRLRSRTNRSDASV